MKPPIDLNERTNRGRHGQRRAHILWVAEAMAAESGLESITMAALARRIGTSSAALYKHYDSRQALLSALALKVVTQLDAVLCEATVGDAIPPWEELGRIIGVYAALYTQRVSAAVVVTAFVSDPRTLVQGDVRGQVWHLMERFAEESSLRTSEALSHPYEIEGAPRLLLCARREVVLDPKQGAHVTPEVNHAQGLPLAEVEPESSPRDEVR